MKKQIYECDLCGSTFDVMPQHAIVIKFKRFWWNWEGDSHWTREKIMVCPACQSAIKDMFSSNCNAMMDEEVFAHENIC